MTLVRIVDDPAVQESHFRDSFACRPLAHVRPHALSMAASMVPPPDGLGWDAGGYPPPGSRGVTEAIVRDVLNVGDDRANDQVAARRFLTSPPAASPDGRLPLDPAVPPADLLPVPRWEPRTNAVHRMIQLTDVLAISLSKFEQSSFQRAQRDVERLDLRVR